MLTWPASKQILLSFTVIALLSSCSKTSDRAKPSTPSPQAAAPLTQKPQSADTTIALSSDTTTAQSSDTTLAQSADSTAANRSSSGQLSLQIQSSDLSTSTITPTLAKMTPAVADRKAEAENKDESEMFNFGKRKKQKVFTETTPTPKVGYGKPNTESQQPQQTAAPNTTQEEKKPDSAQEGFLKPEESFRVEIKNSKVLAQLIADKNLVLFHQKVQKESDVKEKLMHGNEDMYCKVVSREQLAEKDVLSFDVSDIKKINEELDVFETTYSFKSDKKMIEFICTHTTSEFDLIDFAKNFSTVVDVFDIEGHLIKFEDHVNYKTQSRMTNVVKILDADKLQKLVANEKATEQFAINNGEVSSLDKLSNEIAGGIKRMACYVSEKVGDFDKSKIYIRVTHGQEDDTPPNIPVGNAFSVFRADEKNYFRVVCNIRKDVTWFELTDAMKGVFQFGALPRLEYNKKFDEVAAIHNRFLKEEKK